MSQKYTLSQSLAAKEWLKDRCEFGDHVLCPVKDAYKDYELYFQRPETETVTSADAVVSKHKFSNLVITAAHPHFLNQTVSRERTKHVDSSV